MKKEIQQDFIEGLRTAKGDRLVDIIGIWGFRIQQTALRKDYGLVADYTSKVVPELVRIFTNPDTDVALRGTIATTIISFGLVLDDLVYKGEYKLNNVPVFQKLYREVIGAIDVCLEYPIAVSGKKAILESLPRFTETENTRKLKEKITDRL